MEEHRREPFLLYIADWCVHFPWQGPDDPADFAEGVDSDRIPDKFGSQYPHEHRRAYREMVEAQDRNVGRILGKIRDLGLTSNTLLIFASDNGGHHEVTDNAPLRGAKGDMFEGGQRVPACACWPGTIPGGRESDETVLTMDIFPTLLSLAGLQPPPGVAFDGIDISGHLLRRESLPGRRLFWRMGPGKAAVREGQWKYVRQEESESLFDLNADPGENDNRMEGSPDIASNLKAALRSWEEEVDGNR